MILIELDRSHCRRRQQRDFRETEDRCGDIRVLPNLRKSRVLSANGPGQKATHVQSCPTASLNAEGDWPVFFLNNREK